MRLLKQKSILTIVGLFFIGFTSCNANIPTNYFGLILVVGIILTAIYYFLKSRFIHKSKLLVEHQEAERLKEMNNFKTRLYTNITHEFRTPLTVILGLSDQIADNLEDLSHEKIKEHLGLVRSNGKNLLHLVNQILDLSKLESSTMRTDLVQADIIQHLQSIIASFSPFAETQKVQLSFQSNIKSLPMDLDKDMMLKIISNLISNALKYTHEGGKVQLMVERPNEQLLTIRVSDTGTGIPKEAVPHIFDRFFQATTDQLQKQIGTGIGLSLTRELVKLMEGEISVESELGIGTKFTIQLPIHNNAPTESAENEISKMQSDIDAYTIWAQGKKKDSQSIKGDLDDNTPTLLIIEDNNDIITLLKTILEPFYNLEVAINGKIGVEMALEHIPDIILSDVMMPEMDGFEVCSTLKNDERTSHIPIVLLTARKETQSKLHGLERGADAYITKPFNKKELLIRLHKLIELRKNLQTRYAGFEALPPSQEIGIQIEDTFLKKLRDIVEANMEDPQFGIHQLCRAVQLSRMQVHRKIKALSGQPTSHFIRSVRLQRAKNLMLTTQMNVSEIAYEVGFNDSNYFSRMFSQEYGMPPSEFLASVH